MQYYINNKKYKKLIDGESLTVKEYNRPMGIYKEKENKWVITDLKTGLMLFSGLTKNKAIKKLKEELKNINDYIDNNTEQINKYENELQNIPEEKKFNEYKLMFKNIFGIDYDSCKDFLFEGLDIIRFDYIMKLEYGYIEDGKTSLKDFIKKKFGEKAVKVIEFLM